MNLKSIAETLGLESLTPGLRADGTDDIMGGYASDLLSDVLANAPTGGLLLTLQVHMNVIAVAAHAGLAAVVFTSGMRPDESVRLKAVKEGIPLLATPLSTFDAAGRLYELGLRGRKEPHH